jgi:uncharacterized protein YqgC (DUF456 family)
MELKLRKVLTKVVFEQDRRGRVKRVEVPPSQRLLLGIQFAIVALLCLTALEIAHMCAVKAFSSEIFAAISLVIGTILGAFFGTKA